MDPMWIVAPLVLLIPMLQSRRPVPHEASASAAGCSARRTRRPPDLGGRTRGNASVCSPFECLLRLPDTFSAAVVVTVRDRHKFYGWHFQVRGLRLADRAIRALDRGRTVRPYPISSWST
jgi:hypothetical protein